MPRTKQARRATAILAADIHLTDRVPACRSGDEFHKAMFAKLNFISELQKVNGDCPVLVAGDVCDRWSLPPWILREAIERIRNWVVVPGQHDLPQHRLEAYPKSALAVLEAAGCVKTLTNDRDLDNRDEVMVWGFGWGANQDPEGTGEQGDDITTVALIHHLVYAGKPPFPGAEVSGDTAKAIMKKMKGFDLIVTGDNHELFTFFDNGKGTIPDYFDEDGSGQAKRVLVNPGSMMRTSAKQIDHEPSVFLWFSDSNSVERLVLPHDPDAVSRLHLDKAEERNERMEAFLHHLNETEDIGLSFENNLTKFFSANKITDEVMSLVWEAVE